MKNFTYCLILLILGCSTSDHTNNTIAVELTLEAIIDTEDTIDIFEAILLDGSNSKGDIVDYSWKLISLPEKISESLIAVFKEEVSNQTDVVLNFIPRISGTYTFEFTVRDKLDNISFITKSIIVNSICNINVTAENLFTESFDLTDDRSIDLGEFNDPDSSRCPHLILEEGYFILDNGYLEISSGTNRVYRFVTRDLSNIDISKDDYVRFKIKIDGAFEGPSYQFDYVDVENKNANM